VPSEQPQNSEVSIPHADRIASRTAGVQTSPATLTQVGLMVSRPAIDSNASSRPSAFERAEGVKYPRLMPSAGSEGLRQHRVRVFAASSGPARALHDERDERVPTVDVDRVGSQVSGRDDCLVLVVEVPAVVV
jgi:hypothetical protein